MRIGISFDLLPAERGEGPDDRFEEFDKPETVEAIAAVLRGEGHEVSLLGDGREFLEKVLADPPDFVFNIAEGQGVGRSREARVPAVLEMLGIPYSGSDPLTLAAALDKDVARRLVYSPFVDVPVGVVLAPDASRAEAAFSLRNFDAETAFPLILKPAWEGSSKGIRRHCLVDTIAEALDVFADLAREYEQPILVEEFIDGEEITVGLCGNGRDLQVIGAMQIVPKASDSRFVYSLEVKRDWESRVSYVSPAQLDPGLLGHLEHDACLAFAALGCRDIARIDFRVKDGVPYFIEANPLPGLAPVTSDLVILAEGYGWSHADLIRRILHAALTRVGLAHSEAVSR